WADGWARLPRSGADRAATRWAPPRHGMAAAVDRGQARGACVAPCQSDKHTPKAVFWMRVFRLEEGEFPHTKMPFLPRPCQHCNNAPCVKVCPVGARYKREDGLVLTDFDRCIGCRYCEVACPYGVNFFNWRNPDEAWNDYQVPFDDPYLAPVTGGVIRSLWDTY